MLSHIHIKNFQSLRDVSLELAPLTVIVGPSSSGKSALTRAIRILSSNSRGDSFISHGEQQCIIQATTDYGTIALLRGKKNEYVLIPEGNETQKKIFTKLNGATPEEVSQALGIPAKDPLNYASQFDMPYLLNTSAAEVARTLGELTNVHVIFEAAREASRQRQNTNSTLKVRAADLQSTDDSLKTYGEVEEKYEHVLRAETIWKHCAMQQRYLDSLRPLLKQVKEAENTEKARVKEQKSFPELSYLRKLKQALAKLSTLRETITQYREAVTAEQNSLAVLETSRKAHTALLEKKQEALREAGTCPLCGQSTENHEIHANS